MFAGKQFDMVMGVDMHIIQPPAGPPLPIPHPFIGMVFDPVEFVPIIGASILVNGLPRAQAGTTVKATIPHVPIGGVFAKPPTNDGEVYMGIIAISGEGEPLPSLGTPVLTCQDTGMVSIPRPQRKSKSKAKSLVLPTSILLPVPKGGPVILVGGLIIKFTIKQNHPIGKDKAKWFKKALGFDKGNMDKLAKQIKFDPKKAVETAVTEYGTKFNQIISIKGANGKVIDVTFAWIKHPDGAVKLNNMFKEYDVVVAVKQLNDQIKKGATGTILIIHPSKSPAYEVEFVNAEGETLDVVTVIEEQIKIV